MTFHADTVAVPLEDIYIDDTSPKITISIPCDQFLLSELDFFEYVMGYSRGEMDEWMETEPSFNITVRQDVCESLFKHGWGIIQSEEELRPIVKFCWSNFDVGVKKRVWYEERFPTQASHTYRLFYNGNRVQLYLPSGQPCISGQTLVTTTLHPVLATVLASDFVVHNRPHNLERTAHEVLFSLERLMARPLWLSWCLNRSRLTTERPQPKAVRDLAKHLSDD